MSKASIAPRSSPEDSTSAGILTQIVTSKEWVLPPRPKPGRKPSVDTPATKRKAQNREAQRAFRERRATRVQELEAKLSEVEKEREVKEMGLINNINKLKLENQFLVKTIDQLKHEMSNLKRNMGYSTSTATSVALSTSGGSATNLIQKQYSPNMDSPSTSSVQQISPAPSAADSPDSHSPLTIRQHLPAPQISDINRLSQLTPFSSNSTPNQNINTSNFDCGVCVKEECICETIGLKDKESSAVEEAVKSFKPMAAVSLKRKRDVSVETEMDFTKSFTKKSMPDLSKLKKNHNHSHHQPDLFASTEASSAAFDEHSPVENCGFCSDDTPCVCREAAKEAEKLNQKIIKQPASSTLPPIQLNENSFRKTSLPVLHPGPSVELREISNLSPAPSREISTLTPSVSRTSLLGLSEPIAKEKPAGCTGNPGTCEQCQMDPMSTLFCTTVANKEKSEKPEKMEKAPVSSPAPPAPVANSSIFIPCADAYKTLSRHKEFNSVDFGTLVGKLTTRGMQVEVQSVANVLRELDRRLYN